MPGTTEIKHIRYLSYEHRWERLRDAYEGPFAIQPKGEQYLPRPTGMGDDKQYNAYTKRATWFPGVARFSDGITGLANRRPPEVDGLSEIDGLEEMLKDVSFIGEDFNTFAERCFFETLLMGRCGVMVDRPTGGNGQAYMVRYTTEAIFNWRLQRNAEGRPEPVFLALSEVEDFNPDLHSESRDFFPSEEDQSMRLLTMRPNLNKERADDPDFIYKAMLFRPNPDPNAPEEEQLILTDEFTPDRLGRPMGFIPMVGMTRSTTLFDIEPSLLEALAELNFRNYRHSADIEHGLHQTALPTPWITGLDDDEEDDFLLGSLSAWVIPNSDANVGMLTLKAEDLGALREAIDADMEEMARATGRMLEGMSSVSQTATEVLMRGGASENPIQRIIRTVSIALTKALRWLAWWNGLTEDPNDQRITVRLNQDLLAGQTDPNFIRLINEMLLTGTITYETFYQALKQAEIARAGIDAETERKQAMEERKEREAFLAPPELEVDGTRIPKTDLDPNADTKLQREAERFNQRSGPTPDVRDPVRAGGRDEGQS